MTVLRLTRILLRVAVSLTLLLAILWSATALWIDGPEIRLFWQHHPGKASKNWAGSRNLRI